jgi:uncharacterized phiE125 gp8 family phage protein
VKHFSGDHISTLVTAAVETPVSLDAMKEHLRVDGSDSDVLISSYMSAAVASLESETGMLLATQTWNEAFQYPTRDVYLGILPVQALASVKYFDTDNAEQTATLSDFVLYKSDDWAFVRSDNWPSTYDRPDAITMQLTAGFGSSVPENLQHAMRLIVGHWFQNREDVSEMSLKEIPRAASHLIGLSRVGWYG